MVSGGFSRTHKGAFWIAVAALVSLYAFFQHAIEADWPAWVLAPVSVSAYLLALHNSHDAGNARYFLRLAALVVVPLLALYTVLQVFIEADWPAWVFAPLIIFGFWLFAAFLIDPFADE